MEQWSEAEIRAAVDAYLELLEDEQAGGRSSKATVRDSLMKGALSERTRGSIEYRMQNISAVLDSMGLPWINGYKPATNVGPTNDRLIRDLIVNRRKRPLSDGQNRVLARTRIAPRRVYVANFGRENFEWRGCLNGSYVATMQDERVHRYWEADDRAGYIDFSIKNLKTAKGLAPVPSVASRWFNLGSIIMESCGDLWLHRQGDLLWWTVTTDEPGRIERERDPSSRPDEPEIGVFFRKPSLPWSQANIKGNRLDWRSLHPKAPDFLMTEATLQQLGPDYAAYAIALVNGEALQEWHEHPAWKAKQEESRSRRPATIFNARQRTFADLAIRARDTAHSADGRELKRIAKWKEFRFENIYELEKYISKLYDSQEGLCALSGLTLQFLDGDDIQMCCSLDRIDSDGHYEAGNLQLVCRFLNRWKSDGEDGEFKRLLGIIRNTAFL